jgi:hypothetical protein
MKQMRHLAFRRTMPCAAAENMLGLLAAIETLAILGHPFRIEISSGFQTGKFVVWVWMTCLLERQGIIRTLIPDALMPDCTTKE